MWYFNFSMFSVQKTMAVVSIPPLQNRVCCTLFYSTNPTEQATPPVSRISQSKQVFLSLATSHNAVYRMLNGFRPLLDEFKVTHPATLLRNLGCDNGRFWAFDILVLSVESSVSVESGESYGKAFRCRFLNQAYFKKGGSVQRVGSSSYCLGYRCWCFYFYSSFPLLYTRSMN